MELVELKVEQCNTTHTFGAGTYCRSITMPVGSIIVGKRHRKPCMNIMSSGKLVIWMDGVVETLTAPCIFESPADSRKVLYIIEESTFTNIHVTNETNMDKLEEEHVYPETEFNGLEDIKELLWHGSQQLR